MAQVLETRLVDDLDGETADETVTFAMDGVTYEIDLSDEHAAQFREIMQDYIDGGRRIGGRVKRGRAGASQVRPQTRAQERDDNQAIREWARANGMEVADRGRIAAPILQAYREAA